MNTSTPKAMASRGISIGAWKSVRSFLWAYIGVFSQHRLRNHKKRLHLTRICKNLQSTTHILPKATNSHVTPFSLPTSLSHIAMLSLLVSMIISSSFSSAWEVVPNHSIDLRRDDSTCAELHRQHGPFFSRNGTRRHGRHMSFLRVTCRLQPRLGW